MVRVFARQHCVRLKCSVVQQGSDAKPWLAVVAAVAYCRRCINAGTSRVCKPLQLLQALVIAGENPRRRCSQIAQAIARTRPASVTPHRFT